MSELNRLSEARSLFAVARERALEARRYHDHLVTGHLAADVHGRVYDRALRPDDMKAALATTEAWVSAAADARPAKGLKSGNVVRLR